MLSPPSSYLHSKGFSITFAHSKLNPPDPSTHLDFIFLPLLDKLSDIDDSSGFIQFLQALNDNCKPHLQKHLIQIIDAQKASSQKESIVIIHENLMFCAGSIAGDLGLPSIIVRISSAACVPAYKIIPQLHKEGRFPVEDRDNKFCLQDSLLLKLTTLFSSKTHPVAFIWNTIEFIEQSALTQIRHRYQVPVTIDPLHKTSPTPSDSFLEEDTKCISWLDKQSPKSVIYASVGSLATMDAKVATEMAWGLANSNQPFIWVVRSCSVHGCDWIECLPEDLVSEMKVKGLIVKWAPQKDILAHSAVGGFWSHVFKQSLH
ncbi:unnamed protein product [Lactuca saligna]|uniref:Uncharacterized protein n=1 Tax=Lactuca saligna TaxID=75948 RepID=A0AA35Z2R9_LACSI|nr:unnamed protein product [Lactuca saligna]